MAKVTPQMLIKLEAIARRLTNNKPDFDDAYQEGLNKMLEMENGHTASYYLQYSYRRIQNYLKKHRLFQSRNLEFIDEDEFGIPDSKLDWGVKK